MLFCVNKMRHQSSTGIDISHLPSFEIALTRINLHPPQELELGSSQIHLVVPILKYVKSLKQVQVQASLIVEESILFDEDDDFDPTKVELKDNSEIIVKILNIKIFFMFYLIKLMM